MKGRAHNGPRTMNTKMRDIGGVEAEQYGNNPKVIGLAKEKSTGIQTDGESGIQRLDRPGRKHGGKLSTEERKKLPAKDFALGKGHYPIEDKNHARNALARVSQFGSSSEKARVRAAVHRKYPGIGKD